MTYVFDTSTLIHLFRYYYVQRFPTLWDKFDDLVSKQRILSVREVYNEIKDKGDSLSDWAKSHREFFTDPTPNELKFVAEIFKVTHFQMLIGQQQRLQGSPVADPFVIAAAKVNEYCAVSQESLKKNAAKIPNICEHFSILWTDLEGFMEREDWTF